MSIDYSLYKCPYEHLEKDCGHELHGPGHEDVCGVWCKCGFRGPVFYLDPEDLKLEIKQEICARKSIIIDLIGTVLHYECANRNCTSAKIHEKIPKFFGYKHFEHAHVGVFTNDTNFKKPLSGDSAFVCKECWEEYCKNSKGNLTNEEKE